MRRYLQILRLLPRIGLGNVFRVLAYRFLAWSGYYRRQLPIGCIYSGPFLISTGNNVQESHAIYESVVQAERVLAGDLPFYGRGWRHVGFPPDWSSAHGSVTIRHWSHLDEFAKGDIKDVWEPSRFAGLILLAQAGCTSGQSRFITACDAWLCAWVRENPWNQGSQWKCAQETALRMMATILAMDLLERRGRVRLTPSLMRFVREHARRIMPTMLYAVAQDNNHATSEAAALYVAGAFLRQQGMEDAESKNWLTEGRRCVEARLSRLVMQDGSFAQHSVTYHRLMLDTLAFAEVWRRRIDDKDWSPMTRERLAQATCWLEAMIDPLSGDAPNLGANDGAWFFACDPSPYRDFRGSVDVSARLFLQRRSDPVPVDETLALALGLVDVPSKAGIPAPRMNVFPDGGYVLWSLNGGKVMLRLPVFRFRPSHCDILHLDLFWRGTNLLRDGGSFSYNSTLDRYKYFPGVESHNTVQFDGRHQMPRIGRFLWGEWPRGTWRCDDDRTVTGSYRDWLGACHVRRVRVDGDMIRIDDDVSGFKQDARLRWRLPWGMYTQVGDGIDGPLCAITIASEGEWSSRIVDGDESRYYQEIAPVSVIEVVRRTPGRITTTIRLKASTS